MNKEVLQIMVILMRSTAGYMRSRLSKVEDVEAYTKVMISIISLTQIGLLSVEMLIAKIEALRDEASTLYVDSFFSKKESQRKFHYMAIDHALDIVNSVNGRFVTGLSDSAPRIYKGRGFLYEDKSIF